MAKVPHKSTSLYLSHAAVDALSVLAERHDRSRSWIVEKLALSEVKAYRLGGGLVAVRDRGDVTVVRTRTTPLDSLGAVWDEHRGRLPERRRAQGQRELAVARLSECPDLAIWREVVERMARSRRCNGAGPRGWRASFDFLLLSETRAQVLEGRFDDRPAVIPRRTRAEPAARSPAQGRHESPPPSSERTLSAQRKGAPEVPEERAEIAVEPRVQNGSAVAPVPVDQPIIRTFEHPDAPAWIVDLADRIAGDYASLEEIDVYRRWCRGEEFDAPVAHETEGPSRSS